MSNHANETKYPNIEQPHTSTLVTKWLQSDYEVITKWLRSDYKVITKWLHHIYSPRLTDKEQSKRPTPDYHLSTSFCLTAFEDRDNKDKML